MDASLDMRWLTPAARYFRQQVQDPYFWLRDDDRKARDVLAVINEENKCVVGWFRVVVERCECICIGGRTSLPTLDRFAVWISGG